MAIVSFDAPGGLTDLDGAGLRVWSDWVSGKIDGAQSYDGVADGLVNAGPRPQFFNEKEMPPQGQTVPEEIAWTAFPRIIRVTTTSDRQRWQVADGSRDVQDEYCEWSVERVPSTGKIIRATFTCEGPEYWDVLAHQSPQTVLALYRQHISPDVGESDLFDAHGAYVPRNRWNNSTSLGAMHLVQENNTLGAEIELAAAATIVRLKGGSPLTAEQELIACAKYGNKDRNSDPHIGAMVNALAREKRLITLANPIGLYLADMIPVGWTTPDGSNAADYWKITRGTSDHALRATFEIPRGAKFVVGDITINGTPIQFGSQIADFIRVKLVGLATFPGISNAAPIDGCVSKTQMAMVTPFIARSEQRRRAHR